MPDQNDVEHGTGFPQSLEMKGLTKPTDIAVDWVGRNLYWMDVDRSGTKPKGRIFTSLLDGRYRKVLVGTELQMPSALVLDPELG